MYLIPQASHPKIVIFLIRPFALALMRALSTRVYSYLGQREGLGSGYFTYLCRLQPQSLSQRQVCDSVALANRELGRCLIPAVIPQGMDAFMLLCGLSCRLFRGCFLAPSEGAPITSLGVPSLPHQRFPHHLTRGILVTFEAFVLQPLV